MLYSQTRYIKFWFISSFKKLDNLNWFLVNFVDVKSLFSIIFSFKFEKQTNKQKTKQKKSTFTNFLGDAIAKVNLPGIDEVSSWFHSRNRKHMRMTMGTVATGIAFGTRLVMLQCIGFRFSSTIFSKRFCFALDKGERSRIFQSSEIRSALVGTSQPLCRSCKWANQWLR